MQRVYTTHENIAVSSNMLERVCAGAITAIVKAVEDAVETLRKAGIGQR